MKYQYRFDTQPDSSEQLVIREVGPYLRAWWLSESGEVRLWGATKTDPRNAKGLKSPRAVCKYLDTINA